MGFPSSDLSAVIALVLLALSRFQHSLLLNFLAFCWLPLLNLFLFLFWAPTIVCLGARYRDFYQLVPIVPASFFAFANLHRKDNLGAMAWTANLNPLYRVLSLFATLMAGEVSGLLVCCCWFLTSLVYGLRCIG